MKRLLKKYGYMIDEYEYEGRDYDSGEGWWIYLKDEYISEYGCGCHTIHEANLKDVENSLKQVVKRVE